ncbi:MAG TPA: ABC transporter permease [Vicinamibacteria bacterium]
MQGLIGDVRQAFRALRARPGFSLATITTLAIGIGGGTAIFSLASAILLGEPPFRDPGRVLMVWDDASLHGFPRNDLTPASFDALRRESRSFQEVAALAQTGFTLAGDGDPMMVNARRVTASFFSILGVAPELGRVFDADEDRPGGPRVAVLSRGFWTRQFGADPSVVGREILLSGEPYTVIGVMPRTFQFLESYVALWVPAGFSSDELTHGSHYLTVFARLADGHDVGQARADLQAIAERFAAAYPKQGFRPFLVTLHDELVGSLRRPLLVLVLGISIVLLITCANVAGLLLARAVARGREMALRAALGASRGRLVRQLLTESVLLSVLGIVPALLVASWGLSLLQQLVPAGLVLSLAPRLDARALLLAIALSLATGVLFGLAPAIQGSRSQLNDALRQSGHGVTSAGPRRLRGALVVAEIAATLVLLVGAGLLGQTLYRMRYAGLGLREQGLLTLRTPLNRPKYQQSGARRAAFYEEVLERVEGLPGVVAAGYTTSVPLEWKGGTTSFVREGLDEAHVKRAGISAVHRQVSAAYLQALGVPLLRGRFLERSDTAGAAPVAVVNQSMARQFWPGAEALGRRFKVADVGGPEFHSWITIVGIVGDVRQMGLAAPVKAEMFLPYAQVDDQPWFAPRDLVVRTTGAPLAVVPAVKQAIRAVDPTQATANVRTYEEILDEEVAARRLGATLVAIFAGLSLALAGLGVYGVLAYLVAQRTPEIGVRVALGARRSDVLRIVLGQGMALTFAGLGLGALGALGLSRLVGTLLYGVAPGDPMTFLGAAAVLLLLAFAACLVPARRALRIDPATAMRCE